MPTVRWPMRSSGRWCRSIDAGEREVVRLRYGLGTDWQDTLEEIGRRLSLTRERARNPQAPSTMRAARGRAA